MLFRRNFHSHVPGNVTQLLFINLNTYFYVSITAHDFTLMHLKFLVFFLHQTSLRLKFGRDNSMGQTFERTLIPAKF
jgi:hypothetical protein